MSVGLNLANHHELPDGEFDQIVSEARGGAAGNYIRPIFQILDDHNDLSRPCEFSDEPRFSYSPYAAEELDRVFGWSVAWRNLEFDPTIVF